MFDSWLLYLNLLSSGIALQPSICTYSYLFLFCLRRRTYRHLQLIRTFRLRATKRLVLLVSTSFSVLGRVDGRQPTSRTTVKGKSHRSRNCECDVTFAAEARCLVYGRKRQQRTVTTKPSARGQMSPDI